MKELLNKYENKVPEIVFYWKDAQTEAEGWVVINSLRGGAAGGGTRMRKGLDMNEVLSLAKTMEIKRMYVVPESRGKGLATKVVRALELWTVELGHKVCILETGKRQPEAIALYKKNGYQIIPNYGQYEGIENSICFQKIVSF